MSKDKQTYNPCDDCPHSYSKNNQESGMCKICEFIYFRDRKQSEGEWIKGYDKAPRYVCSACNHLFNNKGFKYCPNCGAKMKGGE